MKNYGGKEGLLRSTTRRKEGCLFFLTSLIRTERRKEALPSFCLSPGEDEWTELAVLSFTGSSLDGGREGLAGHQLEGRKTACVPRLL